IMETTPIERTVFIVSDSTGITAETFSHSVLSQFEQISFEAIRLPFIDTLDKAKSVASRINRCAQETGAPPLVFSTLVNPESVQQLRDADCTLLDLFGTFVTHIESALGVKASDFVGRSHTAGQAEQYERRIDAINFTLAHDDGQFIHDLEQADVILVGVSRCGKTPTSLYL